MDGQTDTEGYNIIPRHTLVAGYKKGSNSVKNGRILPINNPIPLIADNNMYAKFEKIP